jgi:hypothetical protein
MRLRHCIAVSPWKVVMLKVGGWWICLTWCISIVLKQTRFGFSEPVVFDGQKSQNGLALEQCTR